MPSLLEGTWEEAQSGEGLIKSEGSKEEPLGGDWERV